METKTNWLAIVACVVLGMVMGYLWYGMLFTQHWMAGNGITMDGEKMFKNGVEMPHSMTPMIINAISLLIHAYLINWLINKSASFTMAGGAAIGAAIGFMSLVGVYTNNSFAMNPVSLSMVDGIYLFLLFTIMGAILGGWRAK